MRVRGFDFSDIIRWEIVWIRNILIYDISYNTFMGVKQFCIRFNKVNGFIKTLIKLDILYYMTMKVIMKFMVEPNTL